MFWQQLKVHEKILILIFEELQNSTVKMYF